MKGIEEFTAKLNLPPVTQIGVVVRDVEQSVVYYSEILGLGSFEPIYDFEPDKSWYMGKSSPLRLRISRVMWGAMEFELLQPLGGKSIHQDFLDAHGEGLHHLGIDVTNYDDIVRMMNQAGFKPLQALETYIPRRDSWAKASFFDTEKIGGVIIEVMWRPWLAKS
jgi:4-hydroxyphenylpyruvate dioxygenase-like putative hemolysin